MNKVLAFLFASMLMTLYPIQSSAHGDGENGMEGRDSLLSLCTLIPKEEAHIPDFTQASWEQYGDVLKRSTMKDMPDMLFTYTFYHDNERPDVVIAGMSVVADNLTRLTWQAGKALRTVRVEMKEMVCEIPIVKLNEVKFDLTKFREDLVQN